MSETDQRIEALAKRVARLESANRLMKIFGLIAFGSLIAITRIPLTSAMPTFPSVTTRQLNLVDASGTLLASLGPSPAGANLTFFDSTGARTVLVGMGPFNAWAGVTAFDGNTALPGGSGIVRGHWGISNNVGATEFFKDQNDKTRASLFESGSNGQNLGYSLAFFDSGNKLLTSFGEVSSGIGAGLLVFDGNEIAAGTGVVRAGFGGSGPSAPHPGFGMLVNGPSDQPRVSIGTTVDGTSGAAASLYDANGKLLTALGESVNGQAAGLFAFDGNSVLAGNGISRGEWGVFSPTPAGIGGVGVIVFDGNGADRVNEGMTSDQRFFGLTVLDPTGVPRISLNEDAFVNTSSLTLFDSTGTQTAHLP